jgi:hypothetical protein
MVWKLPICIVAALALTPIVSFASSAPVGKASRAPMLTRAPEFDLSRYHLRASLGVAWPSPQRRLTRSGRFGFDVGLGSPLASAEPASQREAAHTRAIVIDAGLAARAQGEPHRPGDADNVEGFGGLAAFASKEAPAPPADLGNRLLQVGAVQMMRDALSRQDGAPSTLGPAEKVAEGRDVFRKGDDPQLAQEAVGAHRSILCARRRRANSEEWRRGRRQRQSAGCVLCGRAVLRLRCVGRNGPRPPAQYDLRFEFAESGPVAEVIDLSEIGPARRLSRRNIVGKLA